MKLLFSIVFICLFFYSTAYTQITVTNSDVPVVVGQEYEFNSILPVSLPQIQAAAVPGANQTWDFSGISLSGTYTPNIYIPLPANPPYPDASYYYNDEYSILGFALPSKEYEKKDDTGIYELGFTLDSNYINIPNMTGSFVILHPQKVDYTPSYKKTIFPMTYNYPHVDTTTTKRTIIAYATVPSLLLINAKIGYQITYQRIISQLGWGKIKLPGYNSDNDVLMLSIRETMIDSIFINEIPAPQTYLNYLSLQQGKTYYYDNIYFYGKGYPSYLLKAYKYVDNGATTASGGYVYVNLTPVTEIPGVLPAPSIAYPNPANDNFKISFDKNNNEAWILNFYSSDGILVNTMNINNPSGDVVLDVNFGNATPEGVYFYNISDNTLSTRFSGKIVLVK